MSNNIKYIPERLLTIGGLLICGLIVWANNLYAYKYYPYMSIALLLILFLNFIGKKIPMLNIMSITAILQLLIAPTELTEQDAFYGLPIDPEEYYEYFFPAVYFLVFGIAIGTKEFDYPTLIQRIEEKIASFDPKTPFYLLATGILGYMTKPFFPGAIGFINDLMIKCLNIGAIYLIFSKSNSKYMILTLVVMINFAVSVYSTLFWDFLLWSLILLFMFALKYRPNILVKIGALVVAAVFITVLQNVKAQYRFLLKENNVVSLSGKLDVFQQMMFESWEQKTEEKTGLEEEEDHLMVRFNQGYWDAMAYGRVPSEEEFVYGKTIFLGTIGAFVPRAVWPDKPGVNTEFFEKYTGHHGLNGSYISLSPVVESYINFGYTGGIVFLFFFGLFLSMYYNRLLRKAISKQPTLLLWLPLIFYQVIRIETDFVVIFNHLIKSSVFVWMIFSFFDKVLKMEL